ncbi:MAG TPA: hypothetical protein VLO13_09650 [Halomonas sp.]|nr:hypothetical protein [Halomonas sp.]
MNVADILNGVEPRVVDVVDVVDEITRAAFDIENWKPVRNPAQYDESMGWVETLIHL